MKDAAARKKWASMRMQRERNQKMKGVGQGRKGRGGGKEEGGSKSEWNDSVDDILSFMDSFDESGMYLWISSVENRPLPQPP